MGIMTDNDCMLSSLESMLKKGEQLYSPFNGKNIEWFNRVPLDIEKVKIHKSFIPNQYVMKIVFNEGKPIKIRISLKVFGGKFIHQKDNALNFIEFLTKYKI